MLKPGDYVAPTGGLITGSVLDCDKKKLERLLKDYDRQLYLKWNPKKRKGWGTWEVRRAPDYLTPVFKGEFEGQKIYSMERKELDIVHHVLDVPYLSYDLIAKLKKMDTWNSADWVGEQDLKAAEMRKQFAADARAELKYGIQQHKREWRDFAELVKQGMNPADVLKGIWGQK